MVQSVKPIIFSAVLLIATFISVSVVFAVNPKANAQAIKVATRSAIGKEKLAAAKVILCQKVEAAIQKRSTQMATRSANMQKVFDSIAARVETYYTNKVIPAGKSVTNYDALVADIATKKTDVATEVTTAQTDASSFSCSTADPKGQMTVFREDMQEIIAALKNYRTSIKNLIVAVRSVTGTENSATSSSKGNQ
jgi:RNase P/RNase MRP subunit POP5